MNNEKINSILRYSFSHVPHYRRMFNDMLINPQNENAEDYFTSIPLLAKDTVLKNTKEFISDEFAINDLDVDRTSGSTGKILNIYWNEQDKIRSLMSLWSARKILHNILPSSKCCYFHSIAYRTASDLSEKEVFSPRMMIRDKGLVLSLSKLSFDEKTLNAYYNKLLDFNPEWIMCHPSTLYLFTDYIEKTGKKGFDNLKFIELTGEYLIESYRNKITEVLDVPTANHYGAKEVNGIAYECKNGHLHCLENNVFVEVINEKGEACYDYQGHVCITGLNNRSMPFIRYDLGDVAIMREGGKCGCGNTTPYLEIRAGRGNDVVELVNGTEVECVVFFYVVEWVNSLINNAITQFQIIRTSANKFNVKLVLTEKNNSILEKVKSEFIAKISEYGFRNCVWDFSVVDIIPPQENTQKLNFYYDLSSNANI